MEHTAIQISQSFLQLALESHFPLLKDSCQYQIIKRVKPRFTDKSSDIFKIIKIQSLYLQSFQTNRGWNPNFPAGSVSLIPSVNPPKDIPYHTPLQVHRKALMFTTISTTHSRKEFAHHPSLTSSLKASNKGQSVSQMTSGFGFHCSLRDTRQIDLPCIIS